MYFSQPVSCSPCRWSVMAYRRSVLSCDLKNKTLSMSTRRKRAVCKRSVPPSGPRRRNSSRLTRKRRAACRVTVQHCVLRKRQRCRNRSSWRRTLPGQCTVLHYPELCLTPTFVYSLCFICLTLLQHVLLHSAPHTLLCVSPHPFELFLFLVVRVPRMLSWATASKPWRDPSRSWRRGWWPCSSSTRRIAPSCKPNWKKQTAAARLCRERYVLKTKKYSTRCQVSHNH